MSTIINDKHIGWSACAITHKTREAASKASAKLAPSSLEIPSPYLTIEEKYGQTEGCEQSTDA